MDPGAARKLLASGVPIFMMPLDSTQWKLDDGKFAEVAARSTPSTDALLVLTTEWRLATHQHAPTLFDAMAVTYALRPDICPTTPLRLQVDDKGFTRVVEGQVNAHACLKGNGDAFFDLLLPRLSAKNLSTVVIVFVITPVATHVTPLVKLVIMGVLVSISLGRASVVQRGIYCPEPTAESKETQLQRSEPWQAFDFHLAMAFC